ncbi:cytochrome P450 [Alloiococcus sp. CFN-8]|uniref:cytochrome P450 n=1 Tax=Alloiococcus sp. CFN-8 TaxID=3416081 RepID=UPI003CF48315
MNSQNTIPKDKGIDNTLKLLTEGYLFIKNRGEKLNSDIFETRLLGQKAICLIGEEGSRLFYNPELFIRSGAAPKRVQKTLFGINAIQATDGEKHLHRKELFMSLLMNPERIEDLAKIFRDKLSRAAAQWEEAEEVVIFEEMKNIICSSAFQWVGLPLKDDEIKAKAQNFIDMIYSFGSVGPKYWKGKKARCREELFLQRIIKKVRLGELICHSSSPLYVVSSYKEEEEELPEAMAAIELINIIRPIVAISTFITFSCLAIYEYPALRRELRLKNEDYYEYFVQEVRRFYPFAPFVGARVKKDFIYRGVNFTQGTLVILDIYGTNHDPKIWSNPYEFNPLRFRAKERNKYSFIPQGGGDYLKGHRCPGEEITLELMKVFIDFFVNGIEYKLPKQNLSYNLHKIPTLPESGFIICTVRKKKT